MEKINTDYKQRTCNIQAFQDEWLNVRKLYSSVYVLAKN